MKNLVLASALGTLAGTFAIPALTGPIHYQVTKPHSMFGWLPVANPQTGSSSLTVGTVPLDFVLTDVVTANEIYRVFVVTVNGLPVLSTAVEGTNYAPNGHVQLAHGVFVPAGSTIAIQASGQQLGTTTPSPVTIAGYVQ